MIKLRNKDGNIILTSVPKEDTGKKLLPTATEPQFRNFDFKVSDMPLESTTLDGINALIQGEHAKGVIDKQKISNGEYTFEQLYSMIGKLSATVNKYVTKAIEE